MHPQGYDDGSYDDEEEKEIEPQQPKESKDSDRKLRLAFLSTVNSVTRGKVHIETEGRHRSLTAMEGDPVIIINPSLKAPGLMRLNLFFQILLGTGQGILNSPAHQIYIFILRMMI